MAAKKKDSIDPVIVGMAEVPTEIMAQAIVDVANAAKKLANSRLTKRAILVLLRDETNLPMRQIEIVLDAAANLDKYVKR